MGTLAFRFLYLATLALLVGVGCGGPPDAPARPGSGGIAFGPDGPGGAGGTGSAGEGGSGGAGGAGGEEDPLPALEIHALHPRQGGVYGGTPVTITGAAFVASVPGEAFGQSTVVLFGDNPATDYRVIDDRTILAISPVGWVGDADVVVRNSSGEVRCEGCFHYLPPLQLHAVEPNEGSIDGGSRILLRGDGLAETTTVLIGGRAALDLELQDDGSLSAILPPGDEPGLVDVRVYDTSRQSLLRRAFRYGPALRVEGIEPPSSPLAGGGSVLLLGEGFSSSTRVLFDGQEVPFRLGEEGLWAEVPAADAAGPVVVEIHEGASRFALPFAYFEPDHPGLELHGLFPRRGPLEGGTWVTILGSGFDAENLAVYFGDTPSPFFQVESANVVRAIVPAAPRGLADLRVRTAEGERVLEGAFRYELPLALHAVLPRSGPSEGGTRISVHGAGFPPRPRVFVGAREATEVRRIDESLIEVRTPPGTDGPMPVRVVDGDAPEGRAVLPNAFAYEGPLRLDLVEPATGARAGGTRLIARGGGFRGKMKARFDEELAPSVRVLDPFTLEVFSPRGDVGLVDLRFERSDGAWAELEGGFYYFNPAASQGGASGGPLEGVLNVTVLARSGPNRNRPIEGCRVQVGTEDAAPLAERTDDRGQVTFSSPSLVKAVDVSVACEDYEMATLVSQVSENATVLLRFTGIVRPPPPPEEEEEEEGEEPEVPPPPGRSSVVARVFGFKPPVPLDLSPSQELLALGSIAHTSVYAAPPFSSHWPTVALRKEGEAYGFQFWGSSHSTLYAVYGIHDADTGAFEPLLLGFERGISVPEHETTVVDLILDTRLNQEIPIALPEPAWYGRGEITVRAFLDLGSDGIIPLGSATNVNQAARVLLPRMPAVSGEDLIFQAWSSRDGAKPWSVTYARQAGDPTAGVSMPTLLAPPMLEIDDEPFEGLITWELPPGAPEPDVLSFNLYDTGNGRPLWHAVASGRERRIRIPDVLVEEMRQRGTGRPLRLDLTTGSQPTFDFEEWNYQWLSVGNFVSFTMDERLLVLEPALPAD